MSKTKAHTMITGENCTDKNKPQEGYTQWSLKSFAELWYSDWE